MCQCFCFRTLRLCLVSFAHCCYVLFSWCHVNAQLTWHRIKKKDNNNNNRFIHAVLPSQVFDFLIFTICIYPLTCITVYDHMVKRQLYTAIDNVLHSETRFAFVWICLVSVSVLCVKCVWLYAYQNMCQLAAQAVTGIGESLFADVPHHSTHFDIRTTSLRTQQRTITLVCMCFLWRKLNPFYVVCMNILVNFVVVVIGLLSLSSTGSLVDKWAFFEQRAYCASQSND